MISIAEHKANIGDKLRAALEGYCRSHNLDGSATYDITLALRPEKSIMHVDRKKLIHALEQARVAMSQESTRYYLNGILLQRRGDILNVVATNGHILVQATLDTKGHAGDVDCLLSGVTTRGKVKRHQTGVALLIKRLKSHKDKSACLTLAPNFCAVDGETFATIDGQFPDWARVLPAPSDVGTLHVPADQLRKFCKQVATDMTNERKADAKNYPRPIVRFERTHAARANASIQLEHTIGPEKLDPFGINAVYLRDLTEAAKGTVTIVPNNYASGPVRIVCADGLTRVAMPMRV